MHESTNYVHLSIPKFDGFYDHSALLIESLLLSKEYMSLIENGVTTALANPTPEQGKATKDSKLGDLKVKNYLFQGSTKVKRAQLQALCKEFEVLPMREGESTDKYFAITMAISNRVTDHGERIEQIMVVEKILRSLARKFIVWCVPLKNQMMLLLSPLMNCKAACLCRNNT